ncbi:MAG: radical SAM protein [Candidatus Omnitrophica bacterium]|nr:radical SAM protein [Candidatus Omnitrophota bacterium]
MFKYLKYFFAIIFAHLFAKNIPILVTLCVTHRCNMRCIYCYGHFYDRKEPDMSTNDILHLIDEMSAAGTKYISLNGGEALLRDDLDVIVDKIRAKGILCHLSTNGLLVRHKVHLLKLIDSLAISFDGIGQANDLNRGQGMYPRVLDAIIFLHEQKIPFHTHTVITKNNSMDIGSILDLAEKYKFQAQFSLCRVKDSPVKDIGLGDDELKVVVGKILDYKKQGRPVFFSRHAYESYLSWPFSYDIIKVDENGNNFSMVRRRCYVKRFSCHIEPDGSMYPCIVLSGKSHSINVLSAGFKTAWVKIIQNPCLACYNICCNDLNLVFGLDYKSLRNALGIVLARLNREKKA